MTMAKAKKGASTKWEKAISLQRALGDLLRMYPSEATWQSVTAERMS